MNREEWDAWVEDKTSWKAMLRFGAGMIAMCVIAWLGLHGLCLFFIWVGSL